MKLWELCREAGIAVPSEQEALEIESVVTDSRRAARNSLSICIRGLHTDGHSYIGEALMRGATCILTASDFQWEPPLGITWLTCENPRWASAERTAWERPFAWW